ncbi:DegT/DnrJ/EryC1/StrS family aminotransferase [Leptospira bandrabouensis]|uniref:DegT/DnrJ/EryC1/StrS family aminotransferase n=1 Tax=Leptospira bandrabouensis TaxID=2484903 RepID=UPI00223CDD05|nr:DegT/DnrJ/EryC1/StrS family aminotransferase [Leptospira bandrabouensis]MCW7460320.1 DegT/DnrJ/EryC1/StrS family aminotransferase [Leptospira bandrabouensis]MCW7478189.1 DegT/DnrJ/EryC1/StrS family aminotransferase [Leptospira bandrabouensis]MCW7485689.1 DegT/DnrJ/EryC1/StrS family aminotransferase [Leptospira bandrabouensis]
MPGFELVGKEEREEINQLFDDGGILFAHGFDAIRNGRYRVREFEKAFADKIGVKYAQAVSSGTAAIKVALFAAGVRPGDEVITQAFTFIATVEAIIDLGAKPILVNVNETLNLDPIELKKAITPRTKAIVPVHMLGVACEMDKIQEIATEFNLAIIEDNCESLGARWNGKYLGTDSLACAWSFDAGKVIITGEGGMVTTNDEEVYKLAREYHDHGHEYNAKFPRGRDTHRIRGFNYRMSELQAAIGLAQLKKLDFIVSTNIENYNIYFEALKDLPNISFRRIPNKSQPLCDCLIFQLDTAEKAKWVVTEMNQQGLGTKNVPDAIEWHFARYWDHMLVELGMSKKELIDTMEPSERELSRSVAIPILVKMDKNTITSNAEKLVSILKKVN